MAWIGRMGLWRPVFWVYALIVFTLTHTPGLKLDTKVRVDLVAHLGMFGLWATTLALAAFFGPALSWRNIRVVWPIAVVYAAIDEALQAIPFIHRHAAVDDWGANVLGISLACGGMLFLGRKLAGPTGAGS